MSKTREISSKQTCVPIEYRNRYKHEKEIQGHRSYQRRNENQNIIKIQKRQENGRKEIKEATVRSFHA